MQATHGFDRTLNLVATRREDEDSEVTAPYVKSPHERGYEGPHEFSESIGSSKQHPGVAG